VRFAGRTKGLIKNDRGVALLIVMLVTALLIALIFEFAYGTRVSLRSAVNFRDSQRAYYLACSGVNFVGRTLASLKSDTTNTDAKYRYLEQREWQTVPVMPGADTELRVRWEDEGGKININDVFPNNEAYNRLIKLFGALSISQDQLDRMVEEQRKFVLITELHRFLSDEDFRKLRDFVTVSTLGAASKINLNTASSEVLQSLGVSPSAAGMLVERIRNNPITVPGDVNSYLGPENAGISGQLAITSDVFKVNSFATVGGYTKQVEAVIQRTASGFTIKYWRVL